jgi:hypothetical protein
MEQAAHHFIRDGHSVQGVVPHPVFNIVGLLRCIILSSARSTFSPVLVVVAKIVYCKDGKRKCTYPNIQFDFLGYGFRPRLVRRSQDNTLFWGFNPAVSASALKAMRAAMRELNLRHRTDLPTDEIARRINPLLRGWIEYYGRYAPSALYPLLRYVNQMLSAWAMRKFRRFKAHRGRASRFLVFGGGALRFTATE